MDQKEEGILLGELKAFKSEAMFRLSEIEKKVNDLDRFKIKVTVVMVCVLGGIELAWRLYAAIN